VLRVTSALTGSAPVTAFAPDAARMRAVVSRLAADDFAGRRVGSAGGRAAAAWLADHLRQSGATVILDEFPITGAVRQVYATPRLAVTKRESTAELVFRRDFCEHLASADVADPRTGRLAVVDDPYLAGAWVLDTAWSADRAADAAAAGALGVLVPRSTDAAGWMPKMVAGPATVGLPVLAVRSEIHDRMRATAGQAIVTATVPLRAVDVIGTNVIGTFRPPRRGALSVLVTAHFDGVGDDPAQRLPAACDNASGVAAIIETARVLHTILPAEVGLSVALLDGEEAGGHGSARHARFVQDGTFIINLDGAAELHGAAAVEAGGPAQPLLAALDVAGRLVGVPLLARAMASDNRRYAAAGLPAVGIGMGMPGYQTPAETPDRVRSETLVAAARLVVATAVKLAEAVNPASYPRPSRS
jgi:hypothetical protein